MYMCGLQVVFEIRIKLNYLEHTCMKDTKIFKLPLDMRLKIDLEAHSTKLGITISYPTSVCGVIV